MDEQWQYFITEHPLYGKKHKFEKFLEIHADDFEGMNENFGRNFRHIIEKKQINPVMASKWFMFNEGFMVAFYQGYAPKGETLEKLARTFEVDAEQLVHGVID